MTDTGTASDIDAPKGAVDNELRMMSWYVPGQAVMASLQHLNGENGKDAFASILAEYRLAWTVATVSPPINDVDSINCLWLSGPELPSE